MTPIPNALMIRFLTVVEEGGTADLDEQERAIAIAVGLEQGWLLSPTQLSPSGLSFTRAGAAIPEVIKPVIPALLRAAYDQMIVLGMKREKFARLHGIPDRAPGVLRRLAAEMFGLEK